MRCLVFCELEPADYIVVLTFSKINKDLAVFISEPDCVIQCNRLFECNTTCGSFRRLEYILQLG